jgi:hypothetical protein
MFLLRLQECRECSVMQCVAIRTKRVALAFVSTFWEGDYSKDMLVHEPIWEVVTCSLERR